MGLFDKLKSILSGGAGSSGDGHSLYYYVRCSRCQEIIQARVDLRNDLSGDFTGSDMPSGYFYRKVLIGRGRCFQQIEVTMSFDARRKLLSRDVSGGEFVTEEDYSAQTLDEGRQG